MADSLLAGRVFNVEKKRGVSQSGTPWTNTSFDLTRVKVRKNQQTGSFENYEETLSLSGFGDFNLVDRGVYQIGVDFKPRQSQSGGTFTSQTVVWVEPIQLPQGLNQPNQGLNQPNQYQQNNYRAQPNNGYQQNNGGFDGDDIPF